MKEGTSSDKNVKESFRETGLRRLRSADRAEPSFGLSDLETLFLSSLQSDTWECIEAYGDKGKPRDKLSEKLLRDVCIHRTERNLSLHRVVGKTVVVESVDGYSRRR